MASGQPDDNTDGERDEDVVLAPGERLRDEILHRLDYYRREFDMPPAEMVGVLDGVKFAIQIDDYLLRNGRAVDRDGG